MKWKFTWGTGLRLRISHGLSRFAKRPRQDRTHQHIAMPDGSFGNSWNSSSLEGRILSRYSAIQCSPLPLDTIPRSYADRALVIGEAAGQIKTITCGGIYYGLRAAEIARGGAACRLQSCNYRTSALAVYEKRWRSLLEKELQIGLKLRNAFERIGDSSIETFFDLARKDGLIALIREKANFDWHSDLVSTIFRHSLLNAVFEPAAYSRLLF